MRYGQGLLDEILRRTDLVQLVGRRVKLIRKGKVMWGCCPFHGEKSPSFKVENERRTYKCFGCGAGGDAFRWLMETEGLSFPESVERLAGDAGVDLPKWSPEDEAREQQKKSLYDVVEAAASFYQAQLRGPAGKLARDYLAGRGLDQVAIAKFRLGYAPQGHMTLIEHLRGHNIPLDDLVAAGLARPADDGRPARDFFYHRLMFPIADSRGRAIAFGARALDPDAKPKYINTGETVLFSKGQNLYNFAAARAPATKAGTIILAEGYMDVIALVRAGFEQAVAPLGTALTEGQLGLLWRTAPEPILAFDGDSAGLRAGARAAHLALPHLKPGHSLRFAFLPAGEDPDTLIAREGPAGMRKVLDAAEPLIDVLWRGETEDKDFSTPERRAGLEQSLRELTGRIGDSAIADHYRQAFRDRLFEMFKRKEQAPRPAREAARGQRQGRRGPPLPAYRLETVSPAVRNSLLARGGRGGARKVKEFEFMALLLELPELALSHAETLAATTLTDHQLDRLRQELLNLAASGSRLEKQALENHLARSDLAELAQRLITRRAAGQRLAEDEAPNISAPAGQGGGEDVEARWLHAAAQLRALAESGPERAGALERFAAEASEESWRDVHRLLGPYKE